MCAYTYGGCWAHRQRVSTTFWTRKNSFSHIFLLCSWRGSNLGSLDLESDEPSRHHVTSSLVVWGWVGGRVKGGGCLLRSAAKNSISFHMNELNRTLDNIKSYSEHIFPRPHNLTTLRAFYLINVHYKQRSRARGQHKSPMLSDPLREPAWPGG